MISAYEDGRPNSNNSVTDSLSTFQQQCHYILNTPNFRECFEFLLVCERTQSRHLNNRYESYLFTYLL